MHVNNVLKDHIFITTMDWDILYDFQKAFRAEKAISGASLLRRLNLSPNSLQYLYSKKITPSKRDGSIGSELRQALEILINSPQDQMILTDDSSLSEKVNDVLLSEDNEAKLGDAHILDVVVIDEDSNSVDVMFTGRFNEDKVRATLEELAFSLRLRINEYKSAIPFGYFEPSRCIVRNRVDGAQ